jgi:hypothetical protein
LISADLKILLEPLYRETIAFMQRDSKLGYGFLFIGAAMPYLIEHLFGPITALIATLVCAIVGVIFLWSGHLHREPLDPPMKLVVRIGTTVLAISVIFCICFMGWKVYAQPKHSQEKKEISSPVSSPPPPVASPPQIIIQNADHSDCANISAKEAKVRCEIMKEKEKQHD